jgi:hypothetical protein
MKLKKWIPGKKKRGVNQVANGHFANNTWESATEKPNCGYDFTTSPGYWVHHFFRTSPLAGS